MKHLPEEQRLERNALIVKDYLDNLPRAEICEKYGLSCIAGIIKEAGVSRKTISWKKKPTRTQKDKAWVDKQILALTKQGMTTQEIKRKYSVSEGYIAKLRKEAGMNLRSGDKKESDVKAFNGFAYPDISSYVTVRPRYY